MQATVNDFNELLKKEVRDDEVILGARSVLPSAVEIRQKDGES